MNKNIEIINPHLWAVRFSLLPWITDIRLNLDPAYSSEEQIITVSDEGIVVLNKDNPVYRLYRAYYPKLQFLKMKILKQLLADFDSIQRRTDIQEIQRLMILFELEYRKGRG